MYRITEFTKILQVTRLRFRITGNINHSLRRQLRKRKQKTLGTAGTGRIHKDNIGANALLCHLGQIIRCVRTHKVNVVQSILPGICRRIPHGIAVQLNAQYLAGLFRSYHADGANPTIGIDNAFFSRQLRILHGLAVQNFTLDRVNLVKTLCRNAKSAATQRIFNIPRSIQDLFLFPQHHAGMVTIDIQQNCCNFRVLLAERRRKLFGRKNGIAGNQYNHNLSALKTALNQYMAQKTAFRTLIIGVQLKAFQQLTNRCHNLIRGLILCQAGLHRHHPMRTGLIHAGNDIAAAVLCKSRLHFIPVVVGIFHA